MLGYHLCASSFSLFLEYTQSIKGLRDHKGLPLGSLYPILPDLPHLTKVCSCSTLSLTEPDSHKGSPYGFSPPDSRKGSPYGFSPPDSRKGSPYGFSPPDGRKRVVTTDSR